MNAWIGGVTLDWLEEGVEESIREIRPVAMVEENILISRVCTTKVSSRSISSAILRFCFGSGIHAMVFSLVINCS